MLMKAEPITPATHKFATRSISPDGRCFWYAWLACTAWDEWWSIDRSVAGYATSGARVKCEQEWADQLIKEVMQTMKQSASSTEEKARYLEVQDRVQSAMLL